jgi:hypothetical protein
MRCRTRQTPFFDTFGVSIVQCLLGSQFTELRAEQTWHDLIAPPPWLQPQDTPDKLFAMCRRPMCSLLQKSDGFQYCSNVVLFIAIPSLSGYITKKNAHILTLHFGLRTVLLYTQCSLCTTTGTSFVELIRIAFFREMFPFLDLAASGTFFISSTTATPHC